MPAVAKLCTVCGEDVAGKKRMKDPQGQYYCEPCYAARLAKTKAKSFQTALGAAVPFDDGGGVATETAPPPSDDGLLDLLPEKKPEGVAEEEMFGCSGCKKIVSKRQIRNVDGEFLCTTCNAARTRAQGANRAAAATSASSGEASTDGFSNSLLGGFLLAPAMLLVTFLIVSVINLVLPLPDTVKETSSAFGVGIAYAVYNLGISLLIWLGVLIACKVSGGNGATFGAKLWQSFALAGVLTVFARFADQFRFAGIGIIGTVIMIVRYLILRGSVAGLFGLENGAARLIALATVILGWGVGFIFYLVLGVLMAMGTIHMKGDDGNAIDFGEEFRKGMQQEMERQKHAQPADKENDTQTPAAETNKADKADKGDKPDNGGNFPFPLP